MGKLRDLVRGRVYTRPRSEKALADDRKHMWRRPGEVVPVPGYAQNPDYYPGMLLVIARFILACAPGWKLISYEHQSTDPNPPHFHGGRLISLILWGGYYEERYDIKTQTQSFKLHRPFTVNYIPTNVAHAVRTLPKGKALTLFLAFPNVQDEGFAVEGKFMSVGRYWNTRSSNA